MERRTLQLSLRAVPDGAAEKRIAGLGIPFNQWSQNLGGFIERIDPDAFDVSLVEENVRLFWSHDSSKVLASTKSGTLRLNKTPSGIEFEADLPNSPSGQDAFETINRGDVDQTSFGFLVDEDRIEVSSGELAKRTIIKARLLEVSPVAFPAYPQTGVNAREEVSAEFRARLQEAQKPAGTPLLDDCKARFEAVLARFS